MSHSCNEHLAGCGLRSERLQGGGRAVAAAIRRADYDTLSRRPVVSKVTKLSLALTALLGRFAAVIRRDAEPITDRKEGL